MPEFNAEKMYERWKISSRKLMAQQRMQCAKIWVLFCERLFERLKAREQEKA